MAYRAVDFERLAFCAATAERVRRTGRTPMGDAIWTERERLICRRHYPDLKKLKRLLPRRTVGAIRCRRMELTDPPAPWSGAELARLRKSFATASKDELLAMLPGRTYGAIIRVAYKHGFRERRKPYKRTCHPALDQIRDRCTEEGLFMPDVGISSARGRTDARRLT
ncbi:hypothetical protein [Mesorhizobium sp.]|uniref:hypothetical protein n=1 Tax=Mesorhizobium sp. TaxID=1871066 RepID=UPI000FE5AD8F|nr:hypothetical protein [Mesorhizobium sp.]RWM29791.1 MAG: hypothetical protein EOR75_31940 [Mesorhizobium sp.]TJV47689.1 MAG: hypothetical protein E5Y01_31795 [Mesorhizobium sp.]